MPPKSEELEMKFQMKIMQTHESNITFIQNYHFYIIKEKTKKEKDGESYDIFQNIESKPH